MSLWPITNIFVGKLFTGKRPLNKSLLLPDRKQKCNIIWDFSWIEFKLVCDTIKLEPCGSQNGFAPSWRDFLIVSPLWNFKKSWVYCGHATTLTSIKHTSVCNQVWVTSMPTQFLYFVLVSLLAALFEWTVT